VGERLINRACRESKFQGTYAESGLMFRLSALVLVLTLVSCATHDSGPVAAPAALPEFPLEAYLNAAAGSSVYRVDADSSSADIVVRRGGKLAHFGHDHVVSARNMLLPLGRGR
jgi:hypothetical protein